MIFEREFNNWIEEINMKESSVNGILAFWFGLFETENGYTMYLTGSNEFDEEDDDWACSIDFEPKDKYFELPIEYSNGKDWKRVLEDSVSILRKYVATGEFDKSILNHADAIAVGFDGGDIQRIK